MALTRKGRLDARLADSLNQHIGRRVRPLAVGTGPDVAAAGLHDRLCLHVEGAWVDVRWHDIARGGWDAEASALHWVAFDGTEHHLALDIPGRVPDLFRERVEATILLQRLVDVGGRATLVVSARRDLADAEAKAIWTISGNPRILADPNAVAVANVELERLRTEYEF